MKILLLMAALVAQGVPTDKEAEETLKAFKEALKETGESARIAAVGEALQTPHEKVIDAVGKLLVSDSYKVRVAVAGALAKVDHPESVNALCAAMRVNRKDSTVMAAICDALGALGWEEGAKPLIKLLSEAGDPDVRASLRDVINALADIGGATCVEPLIDFLSKVDRPGRHPWPDSGGLRQVTMAALRRMTGGDASSHQGWREFWKENKDRLTADSKTTFWKKENQERVDVTRGDKRPPDSLFVCTRLRESRMDPRAEAREKWKNKAQAERKNRRGSN